MNYIKNDFLESNDYYKERETLRNLMLQIVMCQDIDFLFYNHFYLKAKNQYPKDFKSGTLLEDEFTYILSEVEMNSLLDENSSDNYKRILNRKYSSFHNDVRLFQLKFQEQEYDFDMVRLFIEFMYSIQYMFKNYNPNRQVKGLSIDIKNFYLSKNRQLLQELVKDLEWRAGRLNYLNRFDYIPEDKEFMKWVSCVFRSGIGLINEDKFKENSNEIYALMVPKFIEKIPFETFCGIFSSSMRAFPAKISWGTSLNSLRYFIKHLQDLGKTKNNKNFKVVEELFVCNGNRITKLSNNKSMTTEASELDSIIQLF
ncbi:hypothetical protein [Joostella sp.]|uniref:hypothetical protein n=1 Tax=Joostella sp. TaxID=2231138 RepID=UPI003A952270